MSISRSLLRQSALIRTLLCVVVLVFSGCQKKILSESEADILDLLVSGEDRVLGDDLKLRPDGTIEEFPTLRCVLMEMLRERDPVAARKYAEELMAVPQKLSSAEMAMAFRAFSPAQNIPDESKILKQAILGFFSQEALLQNPNRATLECFDLFVFSASQETLARLEEISMGGYPESVLFACEVAVHRMCQMAGHPVRKALNDDPKLWTQRPLWKSKVFVHSDVRNLVDSTELLRFLQTIRVNTDEEMLMHSFPAAVFNGSFGIVSQGMFPSPEEIAERDEASLKWIAGVDRSLVTDLTLTWLDLARERLEENVASARKEGLLK